MNEELQKALAEFVKSVLGGLQQGKDFVLTQAPDLIQQLIRWHYWQAWFSVVIEIIVIFFCYRMISNLAPKWVESHDPVGETMGIIACSIIGFISTCGMIFGDLPTIIQIHVAPKVWLLEWAISQVKAK